MFFPEPWSLTRTLPTDVETYRLSTRTLVHERAAADAPVGLFCSTMLLAACFPYVASHITILYAAVKLEGVLDQNRDKKKGKNKPASFGAAGN